MRWDGRWPPLALWAMVAGAALFSDGCTSATKAAPDVTRDAASEQGPQANDAGSPDVVTADAGGADLPVATCAQAPARAQTTGTPLTVALTVNLGGAPLVFGEPNPYRGGSLTPLNFRFYLSHLAAVRADGQVLPLDLLGSSGEVEPFGVHFANLEEPSTLTFQTLVPSGQYRELRFVWGLDDACNGGSTTRVYPLDDTSQMTWPHFQGLGYLFFRYEARWIGNDGGAESADAGMNRDGGAAGASVADAAGVVVPPIAIHMGGLVGSVFAPQLSVPVELNVAGTGAQTKTIQVSLDDIFGEATATDTSASSPFSSLGPEVALGDRLRQRAGHASIFKSSP